MTRLAIITEKMISDFQDGWEASDPRGLRSDRIRSGLESVLERDADRSENALNFNTYQHGTRSTAIYPEAGTGSAMALAYVGLGLGETGEVQGKIKKIIRDDGGVLTDEKAELIAKELGDVLWYAARLADELGLDLGDVALANLEKLSSRKERGVLTGSGDER